MSTVTTRSEAPSEGISIDLSLTQRPPHSYIRDSLAASLIGIVSA